MADVQAVQTARAPLPIAPPDSEMWPVPRHTMPPTLPDSSMMEKLVHDLQVLIFSFPSDPPSLRNQSVDDIILFQARKTNPSPIYADCLLLPTLINYI